MDRTEHSLSGGGITQASRAVHYDLGVNEEGQREWKFSYDGI